MTETKIRPEKTTEEFAEQVFGSVLGALETWAMFVGDKLGLYRALVDHGPLSEAGLAQHCDIDLRYAREWLEYQVVSGALTVDDATAAPEDRQYSLPPGAAEVLTDPDSLAYLTPFVRLVVAGGVQLPALLAAYRNGGGVSWSQFGEDMRTGQAEMNRPWFMSELGKTWFPSLPHIHQRLSGPARVADFGCGEGWSAIGMALAYPEITVDGYDIDVPSIGAARGHAERWGVSDRVTFHAVDAGDGVEGQFDLVTAFECIHDLPHPVSVLKTMKEAVADNGYVVVMDERVAERFGESLDEVERLMYGFSMFVCLPDGRSHPESSATGTVMRPSTLETYARSAGFDSVEVLPIENDLWRFYELKW